MPQDWFDSLPDEQEFDFDSLPDEKRGQFGLGTAWSIGPAPKPKLFSKEGVRQYGGAVVKGVGKLAKGVTELGPAFADMLMGIEQNIQSKGLSPLSMTGMDVVRSVSEEVAEPMVRGYAESWKQMVKDPGGYLLENPDQFVGNIFDVLAVGSAGVTWATRANRARQLMAGKSLSGKAVKNVLKSVTAEAKNPEVIKVINGIPDDIKVMFPQEGAGAIYGEGGTVIGKEPIPYTKPTIAPPGARMSKVSPSPVTAEIDRPAIFDMLPDERPPVGPKIKTISPDQARPTVSSHAGQGGWSEEAINRGKTRKFSMLDVKTGKEMPLVGVDAIDIQPKSGQVKYQTNVLTGKKEIVDIGPSTTAPKQKPLNLSSDQMKMGLEEYEAQLIEVIDIPASSSKAKKVLKPPDEIPAETIVNESRAEALRKGTPEQPLKMVYTAGGDLRVVLGDLSAPAVKAFEGAKLAFHSPDVIFNRHPAGKMIYDSLNASDLAKSKFLVREAKKLGEFAKDIPEGSTISSAVFKAKDTGFTIPEIIRMGDEALKHGFIKEELIDLPRYAAQAEEFRGFLSDNFDYLLRQFGGSRVSAETESKLWGLASANKGKKIDPKVLGKLTETEREVFDLYGRKIKDYIPHMFDKQEMVDFISGQLSKVQGRLAKLKDTRMAGIYKSQVEELTIALEKAQRGPGNLLYEDLPRSIRFKFFEPRKGGVGYQVDAIKAYRTYLTGIAKKIFDEPTVRMAVEQYTKLPPDLQAYAKWYLRDYLGYNRGPFDDLTNGIKSLMWMKALGFNPRSAVVNWTQKINTVVDSSPADSSKGYVMGFTKEGKDLFKESGLALEVPQTLWEGTPFGHRQGMEDVRMVAGYLFSKVEEGNKKHAFLTGYYEAMRKGADHAAAMAKGIAKADKTQFRYGRVNMPKALRGPTGVVFQFWSYPIKQLEFLGKLWKENPAKFFAWVAVSEGANKSSQDFLGTDLSSALGLGVNWGQLFTLVDNIANGADTKQILYQMKKIPSGGGIFPYGLGPGIQAGAQIQKLATDLLDGAEIGPGDIIRPVLPVFLSRAAQTTEAIRLGPDKEGLYTIKSTITGRPTYKETKTDLVRRVAFGKPMTETKAQLETKLRVFGQKSYNDLVTEISDLYAKGKTKEAFELMAKYNIRPTKASIKAAFERIRMTATERVKSKKPSKARYQYEQHLKEGK